MLLYRGRHDDLLVWQARKNWQAETKRIPHHIPVLRLVSRRRQYVHVHMDVFVFVFKYRVI